MELLFLDLLLYLQFNNSKLKRPTTFLRIALYIYVSFIKYVKMARKKTVCIDTAKKKYVHIKNNIL